MRLLISALEEGATQAASCGFTGSQSGMTPIGKLKGRGYVEVEGETVGAVDYDIEVYRDSGSKAASGTATGGDAAIAAAFNSRIALLRLETGGAVQFAVTHVNGRTASLQVTGPVPGF